MGEIGFKIIGNLFDQPPALPTPETKLSSVFSMGPLILIGVLKFTAGATLLGSARFALTDLLAAAFV